MTYREKKPHIDQPLFRLLASGVSQRRCAFVFGVTRKTVARKLVRLGVAARARQLQGLQEHAQGASSTVVIDEMETLEHTKMKPLAIAVAVEEHTRFIFGARVSRMPAKGRLAAKSRKKYGRRPDGRAGGMRGVLDQVRLGMPHLAVIRSDECPRYPGYFAQAFPGAKRERFKGRRACVVGQGELKAGGFDPLFSLNHSCAMLRDNLKTLSRRTWCTPKLPERLQDLVDLYVAFHNDRLADKKSKPVLPAGPFPRPNQGGQFECVKPIVVAGGDVIVGVGPRERLRSFYQCPSYSGRYVESPFNQIDALLRVNATCTIRAASYM